MTLKPTFRCEEAGPSARFMSFKAFPAMLMCCSDTIAFGGNRYGEDNTVVEMSARAGVGGETLLDATRDMECWPAITEAPRCTEQASESALPAGTCWILF